ncbi:MAG: PolC-type DNA polymerase III [Mycoplasma sp.]
MNNIIHKFFSGFKGFSPEELEIIYQKIGGDLTRDVDTFSYRLIIDIQSVLPVELFKKIYYQLVIRQQESGFNTVKVEFTGGCKDYAKDELVDYFNYFCEKQKLASRTFSHIINSKQIEKKNDSIVFYYFTSSELELLQQLKEEIVKFYRDCCFYFDDIYFELDKSRQEYALTIKKRNEDISRSIAKSKEVNFEMNKAIALNKVDKNEVIPISEAYDEINEGAIEGQIFKEPEMKVLKNNSRLFVFNINDEKSAIRCLVFSSSFQSNRFRYGKQEDNLSEAYLKTFKTGDWVRVKCFFERDKFTGDIVGRIQKIIKLSEPPKAFRYLDEEPNKRIELLAHTNMSAFDGTISSSDLIKQAKQNKWSAIGIADRYNVHNFPTNFNNGKKNNIKVLYGVELNVLNRENLIVKNPRNQSLKTAEYVVFDIETSGLYNEYDDLIEFAGKKVKNNVVVDQLGFFVKPLKPISDFIAQKTNITNEVLKKEGINVKEALRKIKEWIGDAVLVAHNGIDFDLRFLNKKLEQNNMELIKNPLIDTMQLSRYLNEKQGAHNLGAVCKSLKIEYNETDAHRADYDTDVLYQVFTAFLNTLENKKIDNLLNLAKAKNSALYHRQRADNFVITYVKHQESFKHLYQLISLSHTTNLYKNPRVFDDEINKYREHFVLCNHPTESDVFDYAWNGTDQELTEAINKYDYIFIPSPKHLKHRIEGKHFTNKECCEIIKKIINKAIVLNKLPIAVSDAYYLNPWDEIGRKVYVDSKLLEGGIHRLANDFNSTGVLPDNHLRTTKTLLNEFSFLNDEELAKTIVITNTHKFADSLDNDLNPLPTKLYPPFIENAEQKMLDFINQRKKELYGDNVHEIIQKRIDKEVNSIIKHGYAIVYWISHLLVADSLKNGYIVGSRGSVGSSFAAYLLNISEVNPLQPHYICNHCHHVDFDVEADDGFDLPPKKCPHCGNIMYGDGHDIPFETFLGFYGEKIPDIDLNFSGEYQHRAHEFIKRMFGEKYVLRSGTVATVAEKTAFGFVKNHLEKEAKRKNPDFNPKEQGLDVPKTVIDWLASKCVNVKRTTGQHPGGIIVVPNNMSIFDFTPYNYPADKKQDWYTSHFTYDDLHENLLKFDILGHDDPTKLRILHRETKVDPKEISFHDKKILDVFSDISALNLTPDMVGGETTGAIALPEFGTEFVRQILVDSKPSSFADLIRISGLSHGTNVWLGNSKDLITKNHLKLNQVVACRDDIMKTLISYGVEDKKAFNIMEDVRKGKGLKEEYIKLLKENKVPEWYIGSMQKIAYLFPKAHATAYVINAWRIAWYKIYKPLHFYSSYFSTQVESFDVLSAIQGKETVLNKLQNIRYALKNNSYAVPKKEQDKIPVYEVMLEAFSRGIKFDNISFEKSRSVRFTVNEENNSIIPPFASLPDLGFVGAKDIVNAYRTKPFISKEDLIQRGRVQANVLEHLEKLGILNDLKDENQMSLFDY